MHFRYLYQPDQGNGIDSCICLPHLMCFRYTFSTMHHPGCDQQAVLHRMPEHGYRYHSGNNLYYFVLFVPGTNQDAVDLRLVRYWKYRDSFHPYYRAHVVFRFQDEFFWKQLFHSHGT